MALLQFFTQSNIFTTFGGLGRTLSISTGKIPDHVIIGDMEMKKVILGVAAAVVLVTGAIFVIGQKAFDGGGPGFGRHHGGFGGFALRGLDLTEEQKTKVKEITDASKTNVQPLMEQMRANHKQIADLGTNGAFDQAKVETLAAEQGNLTAKLIVEKERTKSQIFAILTDEQKTKAAEMRTKFEERMKDRIGKEGKPGGSEF